MVEQEIVTDTLVLQDVPLDADLMAIELVGNGAGGDGAIEYVEEVVEAKAQDTMRAALSENTIRIYNSALRSWFIHAFGRGLRPLPATAASVINYLQTLADAGKTLSSIRVVVAALSKAHKVAGYTSPVDSEDVKQFMKGLARRIGKPRKQAAPLDDHALSAIEATALKPRPGRGGHIETPGMARMRGLMDIAIARVISDAALRRSEAVALDWQDVQVDSRGGILMVNRSKTDTAGEGATVWISPKALTALLAIRPEHYQPADPVFTSGQVSGEGGHANRMSGEQLNRRVASAAMAAGLGEGYSGHSGRVGFVARATRHGAPTDAVMRHARWKSSAMVASYGRNEAGTEILQYISK